MNARVSVLEASKAMGVSQQFIRIGLQRGLLPIGSAVAVSGKKFTYFISRKLLEDYIGRLNNVE